MPEFIEIGVNLTQPCFAHDQDDVIRRAKQAGISKMMVTGASESISVEAAKLSERYPGYLYFTAGVHPCEASTWREGTEDVLRSLLTRPQCVAVGECGLDYHHEDRAPREVQKKVFEKQVALACELQKPLFLHDRDAFEDMFGILSQFKENLPPAVVHCFTGTVEQAEAYLSMGLYIGLTGYIWKDRTSDGVRAGLLSGRIPVDRLMLETDAPFMFPKIDDKRIPIDIRNAISPEAKEFHRFCSFKRNEPCSLPAVCELIAGFAGVSPDDLARITTENAKKVYGLE